MSTFSRITPFLLSLFLVIFSLTLVCGEYLYYTCDENGNQGSINYRTYVGMIYGTIYTQAAVYGYGFRRVQEVHGSLLCRGDVHPDECEICFIQASQVLRYVCPAMLQAFGYSDYCSLLHTYKDTNWDNNIYHCSAGNIVPSDQAWFTNVLWDIFNQISLNAPADPKYMSALYLDLGDSYTLYAYGQCHNEIATEYCQQCLRYLRTLLGTPAACAHGFVGGRLVAGSCTIRYELYPFLNA